MNHRGHGGHREEELILGCARRGQEVDWERVLGMAARHGLSALLFVQLDGQAPAAVMVELKRRAHGVAVGNLRLTAELLRVMEAFEAEGIPALPFKGPVLAALLYGERALREFSDVDVLVHKEDAARALGVLGRLGYEAGDGMEQWFFECGRQRPLVRKSTGAAVDLHWGLMPRSFAGDTGAEGVWERCQQVRIGDRDIPTLGDEDLAHFLCVHGTKHRWASLGWVCDVAEVVRARPGIDWDAVMKEARRTGTRRAVLLGLHLAHELAGADAPPELLAAAKKDRVLRALAGEIVEEMFREPPRVRGAWEQMAYAYIASERWRERWRVVRGTVFEAMPADRQAFKLPRALWPLYPVLRPFRLAVKYAGRIHHKASAPEGTKRRGVYTDWGH